MRLPRCYPVFLGLLLITIFLKQIMWMAFIPMWQFPDEQAHFGQVQYIAENIEMNPSLSIGTSKEIDESEKLLDTKRDGFGNNKYIYHPEYNIPYSTTTQGLYEDKIHNFDASLRHEMVSNEATVYPPLYYRLTSFFYRAAYPYDLFIRMFTSRLINIVIFLALVLTTYKIGEVVFSQDQLLQLTFTLLVSFHPMLSFVAGGINSDNLFNLLFTLAIYISLRVLSHGWRMQEVVVAVLIAYLAILTKPHGLLVLLLYLFPCIVLILRRKRVFFSMMPIFIIVILGFRRQIEGFLQNTQFLPDVPHFSRLSLSLSGFIHHLQETLSLSYKQTIPWYWGIFRWLSLTYVRPVHRIINWITVVGLVGFAWWMVKMVLQRKKSPVFIATAFLAYVSAVYALALVSFDYLFTLSHGFSLGLQGRYFFPTVVGHLAILLIGLKFLCNQFHLREQIVKIFGVGMILLHTYAFVYVVNSYYSLGNMKQFFIQASQYKPWFFKSPLLEFITAVYVVSLVIFSWYYVRAGTRRSVNGHNAIK